MVQNLKRVVSVSTAVKERVCELVFKLVREKKEGRRAGNEGREG